MAHISFRFSLIISVWCGQAYALIKKTQVLLVTIRKTDLDVNTEKTEYTFMARKQMEKNIRA
jgi:hypothetical protein